MATRTPAQWQALAARLARDADALGHAFAVELAAVLLRVERRLPDLIADVERNGRTSAALRVAQLGRLRENLRRLLTDAGYDDLVEVSVTSAVDRALTRLGATSAALRRARAFDTTGRPRAFISLLEALLETGRQDLLAHGDAIASSLWRATARGMLGAEKPAVLVEQLAAVLDGEQARAATLYDTNVSIAQRMSVQALPSVPGETAIARVEASAGQLYVYVGPVDAKVRPFCLRHVGKVYTRAEIDALDNGQLPNTFITGGGYNCRHIWSPISRFDPAAALHGTDGRVEEVAAELRARPTETPRRRGRK